MSGSRWKALWASQWGRRAMGVGLALKAALLIVAAVGWANQASAQVSADQLKPVRRPVPVEELDRVAEKSGLTDCFWAATISPSTFNMLLPDSHAVYWLAQFRLPNGSHLEIEGDFPRARHMSFNSYDASGAPVDRLNDQMIPAEKGSTNPFLAGNRRNDARRAYRFAIEARDLAAGTVIGDGERPARTLFIPSGAERQQLWYRIYLPDRGQNVRGGVPLPRPSLILADGRPLRGEALCRAINEREGLINDVGLDPGVTRQLQSISGAGVVSRFHPAQNPPRWFAFFNPALSVTGLLVGTPYETIRDGIEPTRRGGFYSTLDNSYLSAYVDHRHGAVLVLQARAPTTPSTWLGESTMTAAQLRYWSLCKYRSLADTAVDGCLADVDVPLDAARRFTIVVSTRSDRPANARAECGVAWLDWGSVGDGLGNPDGGFLILRQMMPTVGFEQSVFSVDSPEHESAVMGPYFPQSTYMARSDFEAQGCKATLPVHPPVRQKRAAAGRPLPQT